MDKSPIYKVIGYPKTRAFRVIWMLEELGLDYDLDPVKPRSDEARTYNPSGKVPVLLVDGQAIVDSVAICQFLADSHKTFTYPAGSLLRAQQDSWTQFAVDDVESALWFNAKNTFVLPKDLRSEKARSACKYEFDRAMKVWEARLGANTYAMGDEFTVPDLILGHCANWAEYGARWKLPDGTISNYAARLRTRPAYFKAVAVQARYS